MEFIKNLNKLLNDTPRMCVNSRNTENCPYGDFIYNCQNCYLCFQTGGSQNSYYLTSSMKNKECVDCDYARWSELCYECLNIEKCFDCNWCIDCNNCHNLKRCFDCIGCNDCYGCVGLRHQSFCLYNEQLSKEDYIRAIKNIKFDSSRYMALKNVLPRVNLHLSKSEGCRGDYIYNSKNCIECYDINNMENCIYYSDGNYNSPDKDCCDMDEASSCELCYDSFSLGYCYNCNFLIESSYCNDCEFGMGLEQCKNCFGCAYLKNKQYYILNKPYSKEEYFKKTEEIKAELIKNGQYCLAAIADGSRQSIKL